jgi:hypothetical protein
MKKRLIFIAGTVLAVLMVVFYLWVPGSVPVGQQPLVKLSSPSVNQFEVAFDADADMPRVVLLLSPT